MIAACTRCFIAALLCLCAASSQDAQITESDSLRFLSPLSLLHFRETDSSVTQSLHLQPGVLGETDLHGKKKSTVEEKKECGRKITAATAGKSQEITKVVSPLFSITITSMCFES